MPVADHSTPLQTAIPEKSMSPYIAKCLLRSKSPLTENHWFKHLSIFKITGQLSLDKYESSFWQNILDGNVPVMNHDIYEKV